MSTFFRSLIVLGGLTLALVCTPAAAQTPEERVKQLEQENDALRQELAQLRLELSQLKRELKEHQAAAPPASDEVLTPDAADAPDGKDSVPDEADKQTEAAGKARSTFRSADEIYRSLPEKLNPSADGWTTTQQKAVSDWLAENITGSRFEARKQIKSHSVRHDSITGQWVVSLSFENDSMRYMNWDMREQLATVSIYGDERLADNALKDFKAGTRVRVSGTIAGTTWYVGLAGKRTDTHWRPAGCSISLSEAKVE